MKLAFPLLAALLVSGCDVRRDPAPAPREQPSPPEAPANSAAPVLVDQAPLYRAVGTEPGWALTIDRGRISYVGDYGETRINQLAPSPIISGASKTYRTLRLEVVVTPGRCSDGMSDLIYRDKVTVRADDKNVTGCGGGTIAPAGLDGTSWTVTAINGRPVPRGGAQFVNFADGHLSATFGCNRFSGVYSLNGDHLSAADLAMTEMACGEPAMTFERLGGAVLSSNMRVEQIDGTRMRLVSEAGSIDLRRAI